MEMDQITITGRLKQMLPALLNGPDVMEEQIAIT
jgi:hypothetical protein